MKRWTVVLTVCAVLMAAAGAAGAEPPEGKGKPGGGGNKGGPVEVTLERANESTWWLHEVDDVFIYDVSITNTTDSLVAAVVTGNVSFVDDITLDLEPGTSVLTATYTVTEDDMDPNVLSISNDVTVTYTLDGADESAEATYTQEIDPIDECIFDDGQWVVREVDDREISVWVWTKAAPSGNTCIFKPTKLVKGDGTHPTAADAHWTFTVELDVDRPTGVLFTMRDGIPGNWCNVPASGDYPVSGYYVEGPPDGYYDEGNDATLEWDPATIGGRSRWKPGDPPIVRHFYFPPGGGSVPNELTGVCLNLGAGGDMIGVGNTESFYLVAPGRVTVEQRVGFPPGA